MHSNTTLEAAHYLCNDLLVFIERVLADSHDDCVDGFFGDKYGLVQDWDDVPPPRPTRAFGCMSEKAREARRAVYKFRDQFSSVAESVISWQGVVASSAHGAAVKFADRFFHVANSSARNVEPVVDYLHEFWLIELYDWTPVSKNLESVRTGLLAFFSGVKHKDFEILRALMDQEVARLSRPVGKGEISQQPERNSLYDKLCDDKSAKAAEEARKRRENNRGHYRPTGARNALWASWRIDENLTDAEIRDRWNAMSDEERIAICPSGSNRIPSGGDGAKYVKQALRSYKNQCTKDAAGG